MKKTIVSDSGPLISLSECCLLWIIPLIEPEIVIPPKVKEELVDKPMETKRFELKALKLSKFLEEMVEVRDGDIESRAGRISDLANSLFSRKGKDLGILHGGEAEAVALLLEMDAHAVLIDERTTRLLLEDLGMLKEYLEKKNDFELELDEQKAEELEEELGDVSVMRSSELVAYAYEKGFLDRYGDSEEVLEASLYGVRFAGCSITKEEIDEYMTLMKNLKN